MQLPENIEINNAIMMGKPCIKGTRIPVYLILQKIASGENDAALLNAYPQISPHHIRSCLEYAALLASEEVMIAQA